MLDAQTSSSNSGNLATSTNTTSLADGIALSDYDESLRHYDSLENGAASVSPPLHTNNHPNLPVLKRKRTPSFHTPSQPNQPLEHLDETIYGAAHFGKFDEYMHRKRAKLQIQNAALESTGSDLFKGLAIYINGWTKPSVQELRKLIIAHGGVFQPYLVKKAAVTHILTCSLTPAKMREFKHMKVVRPEWLIQSAEQGILLSWADFIFRPEERSDTTQGALTTQQTLLPSSRNHHATTSAPQTSETVLSTTDHHIPTEPPQYASHNSNPFAERAMAKPDWRQAHTSAAPDFIEGYYKNSRLHHLSTWKAELKNLVREAQARAEAGPVTGKVRAEDEVGSSFGVSMRGTEFVMRSPTKGKGKMPEERVIMHCDFDCFFVSAGLLKRPDLRGLPVVVCHSQGAQAAAGSTSEIASCSYEARAFGIKNGMSLQQARKLCPLVKTVPYEFELYKQLSLQFYTVLMSHADDLQAVSVDEALIEVTSTVNRLREKSKLSVDPAMEFAEAIRAEIKLTTGCEVSIGIAHNILLARLATRKAKPAKSYHLMEVDVQEFLAPLDISDLHGFGHSTQQKAVEKFGVSALGELAKKSRGTLCQALGRATGDTLYNVIRGIDNKKLESDKPRKSVSCEINYGIRFEGNDEAENFVRGMAVEVTKRLNEIGMLGRTITLKIMKRDPSAPVEPPKFMGHGACDLFSKQGPLSDPSGRATNDKNTIGDCAWRMLKSFNFEPKELRGIGIQIQKLQSKGSPVPEGQKTLPFESRKDSVRPTRSVPSQKSLKVASTSTRDLPCAERPRSKTPIDIPSYSQLDQSIYQALPNDIKQEYEQEYKQRSESPFPSVTHVHPNPLTLNQRSRSSSNNANLFPQHQVDPHVNVKRITSMLAPVRRGATSPTKTIDFFEKRSGLGTGLKLRVADEDLWELHIDPAVFKMLPKDVQREQITRARLLAKEEDEHLETERDMVALKPRKNFAAVEEVIKLPSLKARYPPVIVLKQRGKGGNLHFTETGDVQRILEQWVCSFEKVAPNQKDVDYFAKFLVSSLKSPGGVGIERATEIMKWWLVLLRRDWGVYEGAVDNTLGAAYDKEAVKCRKVGEIWWRSFHDVQDRLDIVARRRFGGKLSLK